MNVLFKFFVLSATFVAPMSLMAQSLEQIYMKSGSVVEGYIAEQKPDYIIVQASKATMVVSSDSLQKRVVEIVPLDSLSKEWQEWALENNKYSENGGVKRLDLSTLVFENSKYKDVFILERGSVIKFVDLNQNKYKFASDDMYRSVKNRRPENLYSGLKEVLILKDGSRVQGQIIEQMPGLNLKMETVDGEILSFKFSQVETIVTEKLTENLDLWSQIQLLDKIFVKDEEKPLVGFISSRTFGVELVVLLDNGRLRTIPQKSVVSLEKIPNEKYVPVYDKQLKENEVLLNGETAYFMELDAHEQYLMLSDTVSLKLNVGEALCLEAKLMDQNAAITMSKASEVDNALKKKLKKLIKPRAVITYKDFVMSPLPISKEVTPLGNIKVTYEFKEAGDYVLYLHGKDGFLVVVVEENQNEKKNVAEQE